MKPLFDAAAASRSLLLISLIGFALIGSPMLVHAQNESYDEEALEEIVTLGIRGSFQRNLEAKRFADAVVEVITAEDIGKFPDKNVADALQRVPGIVITRSGGEGSQVSVRGLAPGLTLTQLNGNFIASTPGNPSRSFDYELMPANLLGRTEVFKSPEARLDEGGVGGTIILHTRKPLEIAPNSGFLNVELTEGDITTSSDTQYSAMYSWKNDAENFGVLASYTQQTRQNLTQAGSNNNWRFVRSDPNGVAVNVAGEALPDVTGYENSAVGYTGFSASDVWVPNFTRAAIIDENREREGMQFSAQYRPTDRIELGVNYFRFTLGQDANSRFMEVTEWNSYGFQRSAGFVNGIGFDPSGTIVNRINYVEDADGSQGNLIFPWLRANFNRQENESDTYDFNFSYTADTWNLSFVGGKTDASGGPSENFDLAYYAANWPNTTAGQIENPTQFVDVAYDASSISVAIDPQAADRILSGFGGGFDPGSSNSSFANSTQEETYFQLDFDMDVDFGPVEALRFGIKSRAGEVERFLGNDLYLVRDAVIAEFGSLEALDLSQVARNGPLSWYNNVNAQFRAPLQDILYLENGVDQGFSANQFISINPQVVQQRLASDDRLLRARFLDPNFTFQVEEDVFAYYLQADFRTEKLRGNLGVRVVETDQFALSTDQVTDFYSAVSPTDPAVQEDQFESSNEIVTVDKTYRDVLPSFNIAWDMNDDMVLRGAYAKVIARPGFTDLGESGRLFFFSQRYVDERIIAIPQGWTGSGSNKNLEPFEADQFDISWEWYFADAAAVGVAYYVKDIDNFIIPLTLDNVPLTVNVGEATPSLAAGQQEVVFNQFSTLANGTQATIDGFEVFGQYTFDNGFGVYANYTQNDAELTDVVALGEVRGKASLPGTADYQANLSVFYENEKFSARASFNRRGDVVNALTNGLNAFSGEYEQIDVNFSYNFSDRLGATASVINLTEEEQISFLGNDTRDRLLASVYPGRRIYVGLTYRFGPDL